MFIIFSLKKIKFFSKIYHWFYLLEPTFACTFNVFSLNKCGKVSYVSHE